MSNADFWASIDRIIADGFTPEGLKQLEYYAEQFIAGKLVYKRFSPGEQHGCATGGSNHVIASLLAGASIDTSCLTAPEGSFQRERQCAETQATRIEQWSKAVGCWMNNVDSELPALLGEQVAEGGEAHVFYKGNTLARGVGGLPHRCPLFPFVNRSVELLWALERNKTKRTRNSRVLFVCSLNSSLLVNDLRLTTQSLRIS